MEAFGIVVSGNLAESHESLKQGQKSSSDAKELVHANHDPRLSVRSDAYCIEIGATVVSGSREYPQFVIHDYKFVIVTSLSLGGKHSWFQRASRSLLITFECHLDVKLAVNTTKGMENDD